MVIPDAQIRPGDDLSHIDLAAQAIVDYKPDKLIVIGDWWDFPSLNRHAMVGSKELENSRYQDDVDIGNEALRRLVAPMEKERVRLKRNKEKQWNPDKELFLGNHEARADKVAENDPKWSGIIGSHNCQTLDFRVHPFLKIAELDGVKYCHYFPNPFSGRPIGGTIPNRLQHIGGSFVQGHQQGFMYGSKQYPDHVAHGTVCGRFYTHLERYRPIDVQATEWNGIVVLNQVQNGDFDLMPLRMEYLARKYG